MFEQRYYALAKRSITEGTGFGIVTLMRGQEVGREQQFATVGTYAEVTSFDAPAPNIFLLAVQGRQRFLIESFTTDSAGLHVARVRWLPNEDDVALPAEHAGLAALLGKLIERVGADRIPGPHRSASASWVSARLAELMEMPPAIKQAMLEINDPAVRLRALAELLARGRAS